MEFRSFFKKLYNLPKKHVFDVILAAFAIIALYVIAVVGLGCFWTIGHNENYEQINMVLLNLSYSFITGYLVYLFSVLIPSTIRKKKVSIIVDKKIDDILKHRIIPILSAASTLQTYSNNHTDDEIINEYRIINVRSMSFFSGLQNMTVLNLLNVYKDEIVNKIDDILDRYNHDLTIEKINWLESIKKSTFVTTLNADNKLIDIRMNKVIPPNPNATLTADENETLIKSVLELRDDFIKNLK